MPKKYFSHIFQRHMLLLFQSVFDKLELRMLQWIIRAEATAGAAAGADMMMIGADR